MKRFISKLIIFCFLGGPSLAVAQSAYLPYDHEAYEFIDRVAHVYGPDSSYHYSVNKLDFRPESYPKLTLGNHSFSSVDSVQARYFLKEVLFTEELDDANKGFWKTFYKNPAHLYEYVSPSFNITVSTFVNFQGGHEAEEDKFIFLNSRGLELWGALDNRFYFYSSIFENQSNFLNYTERFIQQYKALPGFGHYRTYQSGLVDALNGYDYANGRAYLGYRTSKHTRLELGHGNHIIGNGIRSLLLSGFSHNYFYLNFTVNVWKLHYQSMVAELNPIASNETFGNTVLPKKYMATHYLNMKLSPRLEFGLFESVVFSRQNQFEFQYLNPIILYRTVEGLFDSPDNVLLGFNVNWFAFGKTSFYAQLLLDELRSSEIIAGNGWWGNKWGFQAGIKSYDIFKLKNLDFGLEYNKVRPFTYSHNTNLDGFPMRSSSNYSHFNQALAHPLGANFTEVIVRLKYRPVPDIICRLQYFYATQGRNADMVNFGSDILVNNRTRNADFDISHLQGARSDIHNFDMQLSYRIMYDVYIDAFLRFRKDENMDLGDINTRYWSLGLRLNTEQRNIDY